jgi:hypothetical protein
MANTPFPIPRELRLTDPLLGDGGRTYGPFDFKIFDSDDVLAFYRLPGSDGFTGVAVAVEKVSEEQLDFFTVTFPFDIPADGQFVVAGMRLGERSAGVRKGSQINPDAIEKEFSKIVLTEQELRRDIERSLKFQFGDAPQTLPAPDGVSLLGWNADNKLVNRPDVGGSTAEAQAAAEIAVAVANGKFEFDTRAAAVAANIPASIHGVSLRGWLAIGDGRAGLYIDTPNGSADTFVSADGRTWYGAVPQAMRRFADAAALAAATVTSAAILVGGVVMQQDATGPFADSIGNKYAPVSYVTPRMFGAKGDGIADDRAAVQASWTYAAKVKMPCRMEGLKYNCSEAVYWDSNLTVYGEGAVLYPTAWPASGGFCNNVWMPPEPETRRIVDNVYISDLICDGSKLPAPIAGQNSNLFGGARGLSNARFVRCVGRKMREGSGGGTGGGAFGVEVGATNVVYENCVAEDCFRGVRVGGQSGDWGAPTFALKRAIGIVMLNFTARRCGCAIFAHAVGSPTADRNVSDISIFDFAVIGLYAENCGSYPWRDFDYVANPTIAPQKQGVLVFAHARNIYIEKVRVRIDPNWTTTDVDWLGRSGYPLAGTSYVGAGLSGPVGAVVQGHGRNIVIRDVTIDGNVGCIFKCERAITFGDLATVPPTNGTGSVEQVLLEDFRHTKGTHDYIFDGQSGLDNTKMSVQITRLLRLAAPNLGVIGPNGTAGLTNVRIVDMRASGLKVEGTAPEFLANGNAIPGTGVGDDVSYGTKAFGGGYDPAGARSGMTYDASAKVLRSSSSVAATTSHMAFYAPAGLCGTISTNGSATTYATSSDETLKDFIGQFAAERAIEIIKQDPVREFTWKADGSFAVGWGAQTSYAVSPDLATPGGWFDPVTGQAVEEGYVRWISPLTREAVAENWVGYANRHYYDLHEELEATISDWQGEPEGLQAALDAIRAQIAEIEATEPLISAQRIEAIYVPWGIDQAKRTPYLWAAVSGLVDELEAVRAEILELRSQLLG